MYSKEYDLALPYLEKALEYNPNSAVVINTLSDFYANYSPNTEKYLEYAIQGIRLDIGAHDSVTASFIFLHLSNAFIQSGFVEEAKKYIDKSLDYNPNNLYSQYVKAYILYAEDYNLEVLKEKLIQTLKFDSTRLDIIQEVGKICYYQRNYDCSYYYYSKYLAVKEAYNLDIYKGENAKIAVMLSKVGQDEKSSKYLDDYFKYAENDESIYKNLSLAVYYSYKGDTDKAIDYLRQFSKKDNFHYWTILFLEMDPLVDNIKDIPNFREILDNIKSKFWDNHNKTRDLLSSKGLL